MVITLPQRLEAILVARANERGITPEALAADALAQTFDKVTSRPDRRLSPEELVARIQSVAIDAGVSLSDRDVSSEGIYD
jgi:hypothetical protein